MDKDNRADNLAYSQVVSSVDSLQDKLVVKQQVVKQVVALVVKCLLHILRMWHMLLIPRVADLLNGLVQVLVASVMVHMPVWQLVLYTVVKLLVLYKVMYPVAECLMAKVLKRILKMRRMPERHLVLRVQIVMKLKRLQNVMLLAKPHVVCRLQQLLAKPHLILQPMRP